MRTCRKKWDKFWGEEAIKFLIFAVATAICLTLAFNANAKNVIMENQAAAELNCDEVEFGFNDNEASAKPLGYYVEARHYSTTGEMTKEYHYIESGKELYERHTTNSLITGILGFVGAITGILTLVFLYFTVDSILLLKRWNKRDEERAKAAIEAAD